MLLKKKVNPNFLINLCLCLLQWQHFPKIPKKIRDPPLLILAWFASLFWLNNSSQRFFLMLETIHYLFFIFHYLRKCFQVYELEEYLLAAPPLQKDNQLWLRYFLRCFWFNRLIFHFTSKHVATLVSAVVDGKSLSLSIIALTCRTPLCYFSRSVSLWFCHCGRKKH